MKPQALLSWSSGKDCTWALHTLQQQAEFEVVGLVTTYNEAFNRVAMHGVRMELVEAQARAVGLPLWQVPLPWPCANEIYEQRMQAVIARATDLGITHFAFGDLFLEEVRAYRERQLAGTNIQPLFPIWGTESDTAGLANRMIESGLRAVLTCIDPKQLDVQFAGREFDKTLLAELPPTADPCGERGEFHTFCYDAPSFQHPIEVQAGKIVDRDGFTYADIEPQR